MGEFLNGGMEAQVLQGSAEGEGAARGAWGECLWSAENEGVKTGEKGKRVIEGGPVEIKKAQNG